MSEGLGARLTKRNFRVWVAFAFVIGVALGIGLFATPSYAPCPHNKAESHQCDKANSNQEHHSIGFIITDWTAENHDLVEALGVVATALFTLALFVSTYLLWKTTADTLSHARQDSARQSANMERSLKIAAAQVKASAEQARNSRLDQRPFLTVSDPTLAPFEGRVPSVQNDDGTLGRLVVVKGLFENRGDSLCRIIGASFASNIGRKIGPLPPTETGTFPGHVIVGAGSTYDPELPLCNVVLPDGFPKQISQSPYHGLFVCGWVRYVDLFGIVRRQNVAFDFYPALGDDNPFSSSAYFVQCGPDEYWAEIEEEPQTKGGSSEPVNAGVTPATM
jgi:hypothetical protein